VQVVPLAAPLVGEGALLGLLLLNLLLPCFYSGARDFFSQRVRLLECVLLLLSGWKWALHPVRG
jgi:hypothetical protein